MSILANSVRLWKSRVQETWTPLRQLDEMAKHFRLGTVMSAHYGGRSLGFGPGVEWHVWMSGWFQAEPGDIKSVARGPNGPEVKNEAALQLMRMLWDEIEPVTTESSVVALGTDCSEPATTAPEPEPDPEVATMAAMYEEPMARQIEQAIQVDCAICNDFVEELSYVSHLTACHRQKLLEQETRLQEKVSELEDSIERLRQIALTCSVCYEDASTVRPPVFVGSMVCGHTICTWCLARLPKDPRARKRRCPTCRHLVGREVQRVFTGSAI